MAGPLNVAVAAPPEVCPDLAGESFREVLQRLHALLRPQTYFEIGSREGASLSYAACSSIAVDPDFNLRPEFLGRKPICSLYQMTSDRFFESFDPQAILGRAIDLAFLDGKHLAEFLLRDFANVERFCKRNSIIALHDCVPVEPAIARRAEVDRPISQASAHPHWWTGDVWKMVVMLRKFRPDLRVHAVDAAPTGLVLVTNLDPASRVLVDHYDAILAAFRTLDLAQYGVKKYIESLNLIASRSLMTFEDFSQYFWL